MQQFGEFKQHDARLRVAAGAASSARTTRSIAEPREPFTSDVTPAAQLAASAATSAAWSAKCRARAERVAPLRRVRRPRTAARCRCACASAPISRMQPRRRRRVRACRPAPASVRRGSAASVAIAAAVEPGIGVVAVVDQHPAAGHRVALQPALDRRRGFEASLDRRERHVERDRERRGGQRVHARCGGRQRQRHVGVMPAGVRRVKARSRRRRIVAATSALVCRGRSATAARAGEIARSARRTRRRR